MSRLDVGVTATRAGVAVAALLATYFAYRSGGGADARVPPPRAPHGVAASSSASAAEASPQGSEAYQVKLRLNELLEDAQVDAPNLAAAKPWLQQSWRRLSGPWVHPTGEAAALPMAVALRTSSMELQYSVPTGGGSAWTPDARVWNMNEGSYDQRESIFAPTPATLSFHLTVPQDARLDFSPATLSDVQGTTVFTVTVVDDAGAESDVATFRIQPGDAHKWFDATADLAKFGGQNIELRLRTAVEKPSGNERKWVTLPDAPAPTNGKKGGKEAPRQQIQVQTPAGMSLALWGDPVILAKAKTRAPYNVLWIVVDALRPDVLASFHDDGEDAKKRNAKYPPLDALLPKVPGLTPNLDALSEHGVRFTHAYSAAPWTRPGTLAMLTGARSTEIGIETFNWLIPKGELGRYYVSDPPLIARLLRADGMVSRAFVNNFFMAGYAAVGLDFGFEQIVDHRYRTRDTAEITDSTVEWLKANADHRFFLFCNYNSPHDPYDPPKEFRKRVPLPPVGPKEELVRLYMAEAAKDDEGIGQLLQTLDDLGLRKNTIILVTADHGETLSAAHAGDTNMDGNSPVRFHHAMGLFEETTRIPILISLPGVLDSGKAVTPRVRNIDIAPTLLELEGLPPNAKMSGASMMPIVRGEEKDDRVVVSEGRLLHSILVGNYRYLQRDGNAQYVTGYGSVKEELFDLDSDPGERHSVAKERPDVVADLRAQLAAVLKNAPAAAASASPVAAQASEKADQPAIHLRFAGAGAVHKIAGTIVVGDQRKLVPTSVTFDPIGAAKEAFKLDGATLSFAFNTEADALVGMDLHIQPPALPVVWKLTLDDKPWPDGMVFDGPFGLLAQTAKLGLLSDEARFEAYSPKLAEVEPDRDFGLFVTRDRRGESTASVDVGGSDSAKEMNRLMQDWGYAHGSGATGGAKK